MSQLIFFASDIELKEQPNPFIKKLSINQALDMGLDIDIRTFNDDLDKNKPNVILYVEKEAHLLYPSIILMDKDSYYDDIGTKKAYCTKLEWNYSEDTVDAILDYIKEHMKLSNHMEFWNVWLGGFKDDHIPTSKTLRCNVGSINKKMIKELWDSKLDFYSIRIRKD